MQLSTSYRTQRQLEEMEGIKMPPWVIHPYDIRAHCWWLFILVSARGGGGLCVRRRPAGTGTGLRKGGGRGDSAGAGSGWVLGLLAAQDYSPRWFGSHALMTPTPRS
jgi:hypothetical protein